MKCRILHLPTATYLYHDPNMNENVRDHAYTYTEHEIDSGKFSMGREGLSNIYPSKAIARDVLAVWLKAGTIGTIDNKHGLRFQEEFVPLLLEHFEIIKVV